MTAVVKAARRLNRAEIRNLLGYDQDVESFLRYVDRRLVPFMKQAIDLVEDIPQYKDGIVTQIRTGGKRLRAGLCVAVCEALCGDAMRAMPFAAAVEHLQNFTLVHDDIADGDDERRSQPTLWRQFGVPHAITIGDAFIVLSCMSVLNSYFPDNIKLRLLRIVARYGLEIAAGQSLDINLRDKRVPTLDDYIECTRKKTGAFLAMALVGGGIVGGGRPAQLEALGQFGLLAGVAFQVKDDLLDLSGAKGRTIGSDICEGKMTILAVHALMHATPQEAERLRRILRKRYTETRAQDVAWVISLYERLGSIEFADGLSDRMIAQATRYAFTLPDNDARIRFMQIARYLSRRVH
jgi:geranylgeranyl diphosphate synthase type I